MTTNDWSKKKIVGSNYDRRVVRKGLKAGRAPRRIWAYHLQAVIPEYGLGIRGLWGQSMDLEREQRAQMDSAIICYRESKLPISNDVDKIVEYVRFDLVEHLEVELQLAQEEIEELKNKLNDKEAK